VVAPPRYGVEAFPAQTRLTDTVALSPRQLVLTESTSNAPLRRLIRPMVESARSRYRTPARTGSDRGETDSPSARITSG
jgi:hypothetical protein